MPPSAVVYTPSTRDGALHQGEILSNLITARLSLESLQSETKEFNPERFGWVIVVSQECDLDHDFKAKNRQMPQHKLLTKILLLHMKPPAELRVNAGGEFNADLWKRAQKNELERYHYFQTVERDQDLQAAGCPELLVDFKSYLTIPTDEIYKRLELSECKRHCYLNVPFRDEFCARFFNYLSRIALPE